MMYPSPHPPPPLLPFLLAATRPPLSTYGHTDRANLADWHLRFVPIVPERSKSFETTANARTDKDPAELTIESSFSLEELLAVDDDGHQVGVQIGRLRRKTEGLKGMVSPSCNFATQGEVIDQVDH